MFEAGNPGGPGRPKGVRNKSNRKADAAFDLVFDALQTDDKTKLEQWAKDNLTDFYKLFAKRLTTTAESTNHNINETVSEEQARREAEAFLESTRAAAQRVGQSPAGELHPSDAPGLPAGSAALSDSGGPRGG